MRIKKKLYLIISLLLLTLLIVFLYFQLPSTNAVEQLVDDEKQIIELIDAKAIHEFKIENANGEHVFTSNEDGSIWRVNGEFIATAKVNELLGLLSRFKVERTVALGDKSFAEFGLDETDSKVEIFIGENEKKVISFGNITPTNEGYYSQIDGEDDINIVSSQFSKLVSFSNESIKRETALAIDLMYLEEINYDSKRYQFTMRNYPEKRDKNFSDYYFEKPYQTNPQVETQHEDLIIMLEFIKLSLPGIEFDNAEAMSDEELGFEQPNLELMVRNSSQDEKHITIGNQIDEDSNIYYAKFNHADQIYKLSIEEADQLFNINPAAIAIQSPLYAFINKIKQLEIDYEGKIYTMKLEEAPNDVKDYYLVNGAEVEKQLIKDMYLSILELKADADIDEKIGDIGNEHFLKVSAIYADGDTTEVSYQTYNDLFYKIIIDKQSDFVIAKDKFKDFLDRLAKIDEQIDK